MPITQRQTRFLLDRLEGIRNSKPNGWDDVKLPESPAVKRARKQLTAANSVIKAYDARKNTIRTKRNESIRTEAANIKQTILFGDTKNALSLLDSFEKKSY